MWKCSGCREEHEDNFDTCWNCGLVKKNNQDNEFEDNSETEEEMNLYFKSDAYLNKINEEASKVILTTAVAIEGFKVSETIEIISSECVFGMNIFKDFFASVTDIFGGRSKTTQKILRDARKTCLLELKREAYDLGANAVIAVKLDYSEFSGKGKSMLFLVASGTAVKIEKSNLKYRH